jgi:hypothetical protein
MADLPAVIDNPKRGKACVITSMWFTGHSVYRCMRKFIEALAKIYDLTLISLGNAGNLERDLLVDGVKEFSLANVPDRNVFEENDFELAFFPDVGMNMENIYLANTRVAPVQVCGCGHPVSIRDTEIDYWLGGPETEDQEAAKVNYSERLVLIPGAGVMPNKRVTNAIGTTSQARSYVSTALGLRKRSTTSTCLYFAVSPRALAIECTFASSQVAR